jgi:hypothetical protein
MGKPTIHGDTETFDPNLEPEDGDDEALDVRVVRVRSIRVKTSADGAPRTWWTPRPSTQLHSSRLSPTSTSFILHNAAAYERGSARLYVRSRPSGHRVARCFGEAQMRKSSSAS